MSQSPRKHQVTAARHAHEGEERAGRDRRRRLRLLGGAAVLVVVVVAVAVAFGAFKDDPADDASRQQNGGVTVVGLAETRAFVRGLEQRGTVLGDPDAPVTIVELADLKCPFCKQHELGAQLEIVDRLVRTGKANLDMQLVNIIDPGMGTTDGAAARRAALNLTSQGGFWSFVHAAYFRQGAESDEWATPDMLRAIAAAAPGVGPGRLNVRETATSRAAAARADELMAALRPTGTPAVFVRRRGTRAYTPVPDLDADTVAAAVDEAGKRRP
ncbi:DsbA family protein [Patulibacter americanus]|uniref:DsbA family protein n=1 Tax=Patulibacter americanus TaxID=588672 RepID=UPI0003B437C2|nr:thioredoxin domain-containing protein [Patulibacter americanus]